MPATFEAGQTYTTRMIGDADQRIAVTVAARTAKTLTTSDGKRLGIKLMDGVERIMPVGSHSMAPTISADRPAAPAEQIVPAASAGPFVILNANMGRWGDDEYPTKAAAESELRAFYKGRPVDFSRFMILSVNEWRASARVKRVCAA